MKIENEIENEILDAENILKFDLVEYEITEEVQIENNIDYNDTINSLSNKYSL